MFKAQRYALRRQPDMAIFLEYSDVEGKSRVRTVHLKLFPSDDAEHVTDKVLRAFPRKLDPSTVKKEQVLQLVIRLLSQAAAGSPLLIPSTTPKLPPSNLKPKEEDDATFEEDIEEEVEEREEEEEAPWSKKPTGPSAPMNVQEPLGDDLEDMLADLDRELGSGGGASSKPATALDPLPPLPQPTMPSPLPRFSPSVSKKEEEGDFLVLDVDVDGDRDLNKVTDVELKMAKQKMDEDFSKNRLKPGDPGFEYDKQCDFAPPTVKNEWDEDDDDDEVTPPPKPPQPVPAPPPLPAANAQDEEDEEDRYSYGNDIDQVMEDDEEPFEEEEIEDEIEGADIGFEEDDVFGDDDDLELP